jgi:hypothetical protein
MTTTFRHKIAKALEDADKQCSFCGGTQEDGVERLVHNSASKASICPKCADRAVATFKESEEITTKALEQSFIQFMKNGGSLKDEDGNCCCPNCIARAEFEKRGDTYAAAEVVPSSATKH